MRLIDADALKASYVVTSTTTNSLCHLYVSIEDINSAPSIDIVRCKECKWLRYCETEDLDLYLDCDKPDGGGIPRSEEWFCADGEREGER